MATTLILLFVGLAISNFVYQAFKEQEWDKAIERSWFQVIALVGAYIVLALL